MAKYLVEVRNVVYETYEIEIPDDVEDQDEYFYNLEDQDQYLVDKDCFSWEIDDIKKIKVIP